MVQTHHYNCYRGQSNQREIGGRARIAAHMLRECAGTILLGIFRAEGRKPRREAPPPMHRALRKMFLENDPRSRRREAEVIGALAHVLDRVKTVMKHAAVAHVYAIDG
jgi:hypothetical protein